MSDQEKIPPAQLDDLKKRLGDMEGTLKGYGIDVSEMLKPVKDQIENMGKK